MSNQLHVRIQNNEVVQCWDTLPPANEDGWKDAIEVRPAIIANRQGYTAHVFDITKTPVEIVYGTFDITVDERKSGMISNASFAFQQVLQEQARDPLKYDPAAVAVAQAAVAPRVVAIETATTHDELDALM
jgi:hypothetical protein